MAAFTMRSGFVLEAIPSAGKDWQVNGSNEDTSGIEVIKAAETGFTHYITRIDVRVDTDTDMDLGSGAAAAMTTVLIGTIPMKAACGIFRWRAPAGFGLKCTKSEAFVIDATAGTCWVEAWGRSCKVIQA